MTDSQDGNKNVEAVVHPNNLPAILDGKFFEVISVAENGKTRARCQLCTNEGKSDGIINGHIHTTSNFSTHLKRKHKDASTEYDEYKKSLDLKLKRARQTTINFPVQIRTSAIKNKTERLLVEYVVNSMCPLKVVEDEHFLKFVKGINPDVEIPSYKTLSAKINHELLTCKNEIKKKLEDTPWVCSTADIWTAASKTKSFIGVTAHWLDKDFIRHSTLLSLKRFRGQHTNDRIAETLAAVFRDYGIQDKLVSVVTDNASNFAKAFKVYGVENFPTHDESHDSDDEEVTYDFDVSLEDSDIKLPPQIRCASHTLNLCATVDIEKKINAAPIKQKATDGKNYPSYKKVWRSTFAKCTRLWNTVNKSTLVAEGTKSAAGKAIIRPVPTRWNSLYDAVNRLLEFTEEALRECCQLAKVEAFESEEIEFLQYYKKAMFPIAWALDTLQTEKDFYFGHLAPVITSANNQLQRIMDEPSPTTASSMAADLRESLCNRFKNILAVDLVDARKEILAAVLLPCFKLRWISDEKRENIKNFFIQEVQNFSKGRQLQKQVTKESDETKWDKLFQQSDESSSTPSVMSDYKGLIELECISYFQDGEKTMESLKKYPFLKEMSLMLNTSLPASAPAERVFSYGGMILRPKRANLSDEMFERLVFLKLNHPDI